MAGRPHAGDHVGHGVGLAGAGHAQQRLEKQAVVDAFAQLVDGRRLVARRRKGWCNLNGESGNVTTVALGVSATGKSAILLRPLLE
jgi:hypothetical protein